MAILREHSPCGHARLMFVVPPTATSRSAPAAAPTLDPATGALCTRCGLVSHLTPFFDRSASMSSSPEPGRQVRAERLTPRGKELRSHPDSGSPERAPIEAGSAHMGTPTLGSERRSTGEASLPSMWAPAPGLRQGCSEVVLGQGGYAAPCLSQPSLKPSLIPLRRHLPRHHHRGGHRAAVAALLTRRPRPPDVRRRIPALRSG